MSGLWFRVREATLWFWYSVERSLGASKAKRADWMLRLGYFYQKQGQPERAEPLYRESLALMELVYRPDHPRLTYPLRGLAQILFDRGGNSLDESAALMERTLSLQRKNYGEDDHSTIDTLNFLYHTYFRLRRYGQAEDSSRRHLEILENAPERDERAIAERSECVAACLDAQALFPAAEPFYRKAAEMFERLLGSDDANTRRALQSLGRVVGCQERYEEAEAIFRGLVHAEERQSDPDKAVLADLLCLLALIKGHHGDYQKSGRLFAKAAELQEASSGPVSEPLAWILSAHAVDLHEQKLFKEAEVLHRRSLAMKESVHGPEHAGIAAALLDVARDCSGLGESTEAEALCRRALGILDKLPEDDPTCRLECRSLLADLLEKQGKSGDAASLFVSIAAVSEESLDARGRDRLAEGLEGYAAFLTRQGRPEEAAPIQARADRLRATLPGAESRGSGSADRPSR